jgi:hypothetical protein
MQALLQRTKDPRDRDKLRSKIAGAKRRLEALENNHAKRETKAIEQGMTGEWWKEINQPRIR